MFETIVANGPRRAPAVIVAVAVAALGGTLHRAGAPPAERVQAQAPAVIVERIAGPTTYTLREVEFVDPQHGFATGGNGGQNQFVVVLRTRDGGATWHDITPPNTKVFNAQSFVDARHGWIVGVNGQVYRTADGGDSWQGLDPGAGAGKRLLRVEFHDARLGWIAVAGERWILKTTDGGDSWRQVGVDLKDGLTDLQFLDANTGFATGHDGILAKTTDGGETWANIGFGNQAKMVAVWFADVLHGWVAASEIRATTDGGASWRSQGKPPKSINDLVFADAREGWAVGDEGVFLHTTDGGASWLRLGAELPRDALLGVGIARPGVVFGVGVNGAIVRFTDPSRLASPTPSPTATRTATRTPTPAPTATPSGPWLSLAADPRRPFYVAARGRTVVRVHYGNQPPGGTLTGSLEGAAVLDDGSTAVAVPIAAGGAGSTDIVLRARAGDDVGGPFTLRLALGGATVLREGFLAAVIQLPALRNQHR